MNNQDFGRKASSGLHEADSMTKAADKVLLGVAGLAVTAALGMAVQRRLNAAQETE